jgi:hypothetical protein
MQNIKVQAYFNIRELLAEHRLGHDVCDVMCPLATASSDYTICCCCTTTGTWRNTATSRRSRGRCLYTTHRPWNPIYIYSDNIICLGLLEAKSSLKSIAYNLIGRWSWWVALYYLYRLLLQCQQRWDNVYT